MVQRTVLERYTQLVGADHPYTQVRLAPGWTWVYDRVVHACMLLKAPPPLHTMRLSYADWCLVVIC